MRDAHVYILVVVLGLLLLTVVVLSLFIIPNSIRVIQKG